MFIATLFTIAKYIWKQPRCPTTDKWINVYLYTILFYSAMKKNEILFASKWMELENIILSENGDQKLHVLSLCGH
jgi:hypothetical protein